MPEEWAKHALIHAAYAEEYSHSPDDPRPLLARGCAADCLDPAVREGQGGSFAESALRIHWLEDDRLNLADSCLDRHIARNNTENLGDSSTLADRGMVGIRRRGRRQDSKWTAAAANAAAVQS